MKKTKLLSLILAMLMLTSSVFAAPVALPTVDSAQETEEAAQQHFPAAEAEVGAESLPEFKPGYNILTKTAEPLTFEGDDFTGLSYTADRGNLLEFKDKNGTPILDNGKDKYWRTAQVVSSPVAGETNTALEISDFWFYGSGDAPKVATTYPSIRFNNVKHLADGRPTLIKFKMFVHDGDIVNRSNAVYRFKYDGYDGAWSKDIFLRAVYNAAEEPKWTQVAFEDNQSKTKLAALSWTLRADPKNLTPVTKDTWWPKEDVVSPKVYVDDIMYIPYYKVTYMDGDTEVGKKYVLNDENGNFLTEINPYTQGVALPANKNGWALTPNGKPVTSVALENKDITLYAVTEYMDKTIAFFDFSSQDNIKEWSFYKFKNDNEVEKAADVVTSSDKENPLVGAENAVKATVFLDEKDGELSYDAQIQLAGKMEIPPASINVIEIRVKAEGVTKIVNPIGKKDTISAKLDDRDAVLFLHIKGLDQYYQTAMKWSEATKDDNGWYTFTFETDALKPSSDKNTTTWDTVVANNNKNVNILRFDPSDTDGTFYIDYIKLYGKTNDITPIAPYAPKNIEGVSFRVDPDNEKTGVRFMASMLNKTRKNERMTEYGWIVALEETLGVQELTHEFDAKARVEGKAFSRAKDKIVIDKIFDTKENSTIFSAVVTGIPVEFADKVLAIRPYSFMNGGYIYGKTVLISPREVAQGEKDNNSDLYKKNKDYIDSLLGKSQEVAE